MKVIDLLNKIAKGKELPKKIYCFNREFYLKENIYFGDTFRLTHYIQEEDLNDEVEIIEEDKKIEKLDFYEVNGGGDEYDKFYLKNDGQDIFLCTDNDDFEIIVLEKINEIIEELNGRN